MPDTRRMSRVCRDGQHAPCQACGCPCHHKAAPADFRAQVEAAKEEEQE